MRRGSLSLFRAFPNDTKTYTRSRIFPKSKSNRLNTFSCTIKTLSQANDRKGYHPCSGLSCILRLSQLRKTKPIRIELFHPLNGVADHLFQHGEIHLIQPVDVQARHIVPVFAGARELILILLETRHNVYAHGSFPGRKTCQREIARVP